MTALDDAIRTATADGHKAEAFYRLFLHTKLAVPTHEADPEEGRLIGRWHGPGESVELMTIEREGVKTIPVFDTAERLVAWADDDLVHAALTGRELIEAIEPEMQVVLNPETAYMKLFVAEELDMVRANLAAEDKNS